MSTVFYLVSFRYYTIFGDLKVTQWKSGEYGGCSKAEIPRTNTVREIQKLTYFFNIPQLNEVTDNLSVNVSLRMIFKWLTDLLFTMNPI